MQVRVMIRSRLGNLTLLVLGGLYVVAALFLLAYELTLLGIDGPLSERLIELALISAIAIGALLIGMARRNLGPALAHVTR